MTLGKRQTPWEKEWKKLCTAESRFFTGKEKETPGFVEKLAEKHIPPKLQGTLDAAFFKAFELIFTKGSPIIEKTYDKKKLGIDYQVRSYAEELKQDRKSLKVFRKKSGGIRTSNLAVSAAEGVGLGFFGIGLPDIPLFTGLIFKTLYEISLNYGFSYEEEQEKIFLLKIIEAAVGKAEDFPALNEELDAWMEGRRQFPTDMKSQMERTAKALSEELLYMKFVQGIPVVGIVGGISDVISLKTIAAYGDLKYQRRFLLEKKRNKGEHK